MEINFPENPVTIGKVIEAAQLESRNKCFQVDSPIPSSLAFLKKKLCSFLKEVALNANQTKPAVNWGFICIVKPIILSQEPLLNP